MTESRPRPLDRRQRLILARYSGAMLEMSPRDFTAKWDTDHAQLARIVKRSRSAVKKWFARGVNYRQPGDYSRLRLGLADWLLENTDELSDSLLSKLFRDETS
jgi:hypothetical protein